MDFEEIIDKEMDDDPMFSDPTHKFKGTKDEWAIYWAETFMLPSEFEAENVNNECALRRLIALAKKTLP